MLTFQVQAFGMDITKEDGQVKLAPHESSASTPQSSEQTGESTPEEGALGDGTKVEGAGESELPLTLADLLGCVY